MSCSSSLGGWRYSGWRDCVHPLLYSFIHSSTHPFIHPLIHPPIHPPSLPPSSSHHPSSHPSPMPPPTCPLTVLQSLFTPPASLPFIFLPALLLVSPFIPPPTPSPILLPSHLPIHRLFHETVSRQIFTQHLPEYSEGRDGILRKAEDSAVLESGVASHTGSHSHSTHSCTHTHTNTPHTHSTHTHTPMVQTYLLYRCLSFPICRMSTMDPPAVSEKLAHAWCMQGAQVSACPRASAPRPLLPPLRA